MCYRLAQLKSLTQMFRRRPESISLVPSISSRSRVLMVFKCIFPYITAYNSIEFHVATNPSIDLALYYSMKSCIQVLSFLFAFLFSVTSVCLFSSPTTEATSSLPRATGPQRHRDTVGSSSSSSSSSSTEVPYRDNGTAEDFKLSRVRPPAR